MDERVFVASRLRMALLLVVAAIFVAGGVWMSQNPDLTAVIVGWVSTIFFGAGFFAIAIQVARPSRLTLSADAFTVQTAFRKPLRIAWEDVEEFFVWRYRQTKLVSYRYVAGNAPQTPMSGINKAFGLDGSVPPGFATKADALASLMNDYRKRAIRA